MAIGSTTSLDSRYPRPKGRHPKALSLSLSHSLRQPRRQKPHLDGWDLGFNDRTLISSSAGDPYVLRNVWRGEIKHT